jgi:hypothetical protein
VQGCFDILDQREAALLLDCQQPGSAVAQVTREHYPDDSRTILMRSGTEERVDGRTMAVFFGPAGEPNVAVVQVEVTIRRSDIDSAGLDRLPIRGVSRRQWSCSAEDVR